MARNVRRHETTEERAEAIADELRALAKREGLEVDATFLVHTAFTLAECYVATEAQTRELMEGANGRRMAELSKRLQAIVEEPEVPEASQVIKFEHVSRAFDAVTADSEYSYSVPVRFRFGESMVEPAITAEVELEPDAVEKVVELARAEGEPCPDCAHTEHPGLYVGIETREPCRTCGGSTFVAGGAQ